MSASIIPHVGPAMICSSTRMPASGPGCALRVRSGSVTSPPEEVRLALGEKRRVADAKVFGVEAVEALVLLGRRDRARIGEPARESLVPARDERRAFGDALRGCMCLGGDLAIGDDAGDEALFLRLGGVEDPAFEQYLERNVGPRETHERRHL